jgi:hypothetical protein
MNPHDLDRMKNLLQRALPPLESGAELRRDLWPALLKRLHAKHAAAARCGSASIDWVWSGWTWFDSAWFDGALAVALVALIALFPASIPVLLYYL